MFVSTVFQCSDLCDDIRMSCFDSLHWTESLMNIETVVYVFIKLICHFSFISLSLSSSMHMMLLYDLGSEKSRKKLIMEQVICLK